MNRYSLLIIITGAMAIMPAHAEPVVIECSDKNVEYQTEDLKAFNSNVLNSVISYVCIDDKCATTKVVVDRNKKIILPHLDAKTFAFMLDLAKKDDGVAFSIIDSLDEESFRQLCFNVLALKEWRLADLVRLKMIKEPKLLQVTGLSDDSIFEFIFHTSSIRNNADYDIIKVLLDGCTIQEAYTEDDYKQEYAHKRFFDINSLRALLVLVDFYREHMERPLSIDTDHLKKLYSAQTQEIQQTLRNKNLITLA